jgi:phosphatidylinositol alpha-1,6-mannosyltransferase
MVGRLARDEDYKGHREVLTAWPVVRRFIPDAELWVVGDGDLRPELEKIAAWPPTSGGVRFWGAVSEEKKFELIARSRCLVLPSRGEGFGLVYLEAMRSARPCLVSTVDAGREVVQPPECGLAVLPSDTAELASAMKRMLCPGPEWSRWSQSARQRYESYFTAAHFQTRLLRALDRTTNGTQQ